MQKQTQILLDDDLFRNSMKKIDEPKFEPDETNGNDETYGNDETQESTSVNNEPEPGPSGTKRKSAERYETPRKKQKETNGTSVANGKLLSIRNLWNFI